MSQRLLDPVTIGRRGAENRVVFGPHVTNLGSGREMSPRHAAYYERRARGGCGTIVTEVASVHPSDWPYERAPLAASCDAGWGEIARACAPHGTLVLAGLGHAGMQGSTAWSQDVLWAPSLVANVATKEQPIVMGDAEIAAVVDGFAQAARAAAAAGLGGVEVNAGQHSLLRQFCSGLTNLRADRYGEDRSALLREVLAAVRSCVGDGVVGLRFSADELAPWAGLVPEAAAAMLAEVAAGADYVCVVRGSIYSESATQPDLHEPEAVNAATTSLVAAALREAGLPALICAQGSIVGVATAERLVRTGDCQLVEMTRAQIADPDLCTKAARGDVARIRPCVLCNQHCLVRDVRNPLVSCCVNPVAGHELDEGALDDVVAPPRARRARRVVVVGAGVAGLEAARVSAREGDDVTVYERADEPGGAVLVASRIPGRQRLADVVDWLVAEADREGVRLVLGHAATPGDLAAADLVIAAAGARERPVELRHGDDGSVRRLCARDALGIEPPGGAVVIDDPVGGPVGVGIAEYLSASGARVTLITPDVVVGSQLAAAGDLVAANARLAALGVDVRRHATVVGATDGHVAVEDRFTGAYVSLAADALVDAGPGLPTIAWWPEDATVVGDAVAPRGILMAVLEARRAVLGMTPGHR